MTIKGKAILSFPRLSIRKNKEDKHSERITQPDLESNRPYKLQPVHLDGAMFINDSMEPREIEPTATSTSATKTPPPTEEVPFHRTSMGSFVLIVVGIVILAAIIGGAVGGTMSKNAQSSSQAVGTGLLLSSTGNGFGAPTATSATSVFVETTVVPSSSLSTVALVDTSLAPSGFAHV